MKVGDQPPAGGREAIAAETEHVDIGLAAPQRVDQRARVQISGGLAARQQNPGQGPPPPGCIQRATAGLAVATVITGVAKAAARVPRFIRSGDSKSMRSIGIRS